MGCDSLLVAGKSFKYYSIKERGGDKFDRLPYSIRVLLESAVRNCDEFQVKSSDIESILNWEQSQHDNVEIPFKPSRVLLQDFTGVPAVVDIAAMRDAVHKLGGNPENINPICPVDLVIDHSVQVDFARVPDAAKRNLEKEFHRNRERFQFLKWGAKSMKNMLIVPPGSGIVHQVNLEYLARVVFNKESCLYPDSVVGTDSHTTMINGLGILGWGVGGIEAEAVMLGQAISMVLPQVIGYKISGTLNPLVTSTDLVLTITQHLRKIGVVGKFVEFFGPGVAYLSIADRATISNMCPEYGATVGFFPIDKVSIQYLVQTDRSKESLGYIEEYLKANGLFRDYSNSSQDPVFSKVYELDLCTVVPSVSGPKRPHDMVPVSDMKMDFERCLTNQIGFKGFGLAEGAKSTRMTFKYENGQDYTMAHGSVVIAAITSCTNTSNPSVMLGAGLLARNAVNAGLNVAEFIKTSLAPGSGVVTHYLEQSGCIPYLRKLGFDIVGYGCTTCIGNSGPLTDSVAEVIEKNDLVVCSVLSGNRNFEGRVHPLTRANYLASPPLVIAYALAGRMNFDFENESLGVNSSGKSIFLRDIWPSKEEIAKIEAQHVLPSMFRSVYANICKGSDEWNSLAVSSDTLYPWDQNSTYIKNPPYFKDMTKDLPTLPKIENAYVLVNLGDSVTTDHISPAGAIARTSPAARFLQSKCIERRDFNTYGARRGNDDIMARGTFANIRLLNKFIGRQAPRTIYIPSGEEMDIFDAAEKYRTSGNTVIILAGKEYGSGSSRDWAAKGPWMLGVKAVLAESYERIHRSNLVGFGIIPLQYLPGENADTLGLTGKERFSFSLPQDIRPRLQIEILTDTGKQFNALMRFDTDVEVMYFRNGGILNYMVRKML